MRPLGNAEAHEDEEGSGSCAAGPCIGAGSRHARPALAVTALDGPDRWLDTHTHTPTDPLRLRSVTPCFLIGYQSGSPLISD